MANAIAPNLASAWLEGLKPLLHAGDSAPKLRISAAFFDRRKREWQPALEAAGIAACTCSHEARAHTAGSGCERCACSRFDFNTKRGANRTPYELRHTFATNALAAGLPAYDVARYMGTSLAMIDRTDGHLVQGSEELARERLDSFADRLGRDWGTNARTLESR